METAPLTLAHAHARNASAEIWKANSSQASDEHQQAAGEFAKAAQSTGDAEALRILRLLESHHQRLASIIKSSNATPSVPAQPEPSQDTQSPDIAPSAAATSAARTLSPRRHPQSPPRATPRRHKPLRDSTSSIASNLATARGIPGSQRRPAAPAISVQNADGRILNRADRATSQDLRKDVSQTAKAAVEASAFSQANNAPEVRELAASVEKPSKTDEGFKRFFSTFETVYSALSAPLAFAGLPLMTEEIAQSASQTAAPKPVVKQAHLDTKESANTKADANPDPSTFLSKATLKALEGTPGNNFGRPAESFYVVPTTGGTVSYAGILNHSGSQGHGVPSPIIEEEGSFDGDEFVDANEEPAPPSPTVSRAGRRTRRGSTSSLAAAAELAKGSSGGKKTMEELELENNMMRQLLDKLSKRLHMWEASSQSQSLALAQSFRAQRPSNAPSGTPGAGNQQDNNMEQRLRELEVLVESLAREKELVDRENEKLVRENEKYLSVLGKYREKWEVLKAGARGRRERVANAANGGASSAAGTVAMGGASGGVAEDGAG